MAIRRKPFSPEGIIESLENVGMTVKKRDTKLPKGKMSVVFKDGTAAIVDNNFIDFNSIPQTCTCCNTIQYDTSSCYELNNYSECCTYFLESTSYNGDNHIYSDTGNHRNAA